MRENSGKSLFFKVNSISTIHSASIRFPMDNRQLADNSPEAVGRYYHELSDFGNCENVVTTGFTTEGRE